MSGDLATGVRVVVTDAFNDKGFDDRAAGELTDVDTVTQFGPRPTEAP